MFDTLIRGGLVAVEAGLVRADLALRDGQVAAVLRPDTPAEARETIEATGMYVLPGAIDSHVHLRDPGQTHKEDFGTGTRAAASAGVTTVICQPNTSPPLSTLDAVEQAVAAGRQRAIVDFALTGGVLASQPEAMRSLAASGQVVGFEVLDSPFQLDGQGWVRLYETAAEGGLPLSHVCFDGGLHLRAVARLRERGARTLRDYARQVSGAMEVAGLARALPLARELGTRLIVRQVSTAAGMAYLRRIKREWGGGPLPAVEVTPHHLFATASEMERLGPHATVLPPLREADDVAGLWAGLLDGTVDFVASDHAPHAAEEKARGRDDLWLAPPGVPGLETFLPLLLEACFGGRLPLARLVEVVARNPARVHGLYPRKGSLLPGADADLVVVDPRVEWTLDRGRVYTRAGYSIFEGRRGRGWPVLAMVRGTVVSRGGTPTTMEPLGQLVRPDRSRPASAISTSAET